MTSTEPYRNSAKCYDLLYSFKDYQNEVAILKELILRYKKTDGNDLLDVACGTGKHLRYFKKDFKISGIDLNRHMLKIARMNMPDIDFKQADMMHFTLDKTFDVITCLFSAIGYLKNYTNLKLAIKNFASHLKEGGIVIIEPWFSLDTYMNGSPGMTVYEDEDIKIARLCVCKKKGMLSILDMSHLVAERNKEVTHYTEHHELAMFDKEKVLSIMKQNGLESQFFKDGLMPDRGLYVGVKI